MKPERTEQRGKAVWGVRAVALLAIWGALALASCSKVMRTGQSPSYLVITTLEGSPGLNGTFGTTLASDVLNVNEETGRTSIAQDSGRVTLTLAQKDPLGPAPSAANSVTISQYHVEYIRGDGRNRQGIDVPYAFDGAVTATVSNSASIPFTLVRIQAKQEAPLSALAFGGGASAISTIARVTFYGHDQNGREVSVTGNIEVNFADWAG
jgi:hypothetical protein